MNLHRLNLHLAQLKVPVQMGKYSNQIKCKLYISHGYILNYKLLSSFPVFHTPAGMNTRKLQRLKACDASWNQAAKVAGEVNQITLLLFTRKES